MRARSTALRCSSVAAIWILTFRSRACRSPPTSFDEWVRKSTSAYTRAWATPSTPTRSHGGRRSCNGSELHTPTSKVPTSNAQELNAGAGRWAFGVWSYSPSVLRVVIVREAVNPTLSCLGRCDDVVGTGARVLAGVLVR